MTQDLSQNLNALFDTKLTWRDFALCGVRLGGTADAIPFDKISGTTMEKFPVGVTRMSYRDGKAFYKLSGIEHEYLLADRIKSVYENNGWVHLSGGAVLRVKDGRIVEFRLSNELLVPIRNTPFSRIEKRFGKADKKVIWEEPVDALYTTTTFIYASRQLRITYEDDENTINGVNIGETLLEEYRLDINEAQDNRTAGTDNLLKEKSSWWQTIFNTK